MGKMRILLIGGTGVLSSAVVNEALAKKIEVTIVNRGKKKTSTPEGVSVIKADYRNKELMTSSLAGLHFDAVIDFICYDKKQIEYSIDLLHAVSDQYIFISSTCVYNTRIPGVKNEESEKVLQDWSYSVNKWDCECYLKEKSHRIGFNYTVVRPCVTYDDTRIPYGIMPPYGFHWTFCERILKGKPVLRWNGGTTKWNMMRVEDFAVGVVGLIGNKNTYGQAFNLSGDVAYAWNDVLNILEKKLGRKPIVFDITSQEYQFYYPEKRGEIVGRSLDSIVSNTKVKKFVLDYETSYSLEKGLSKTIDAYKSQNYQLGIDWEFDAATDRIVKTLSKKKGIAYKQYNLGFFDYIGTATRADKKAYWLEYHKENVLVSFIYLSLRVLRKIGIKLRCKSQKKYG